MHIIRKISLFLLLALGALPMANAQEEVLIGVGPKKGDALKVHRLSKSSPIRPRAILLTLPFFDDFSKPTDGVPDQGYWQNAMVLVNNQYAQNQITIGVATFDILDEYGRVYPQASPYSFPADTLTSWPIDIQPADVDVYMSFAYQPGGYGDMPEMGDSLILQFYRPDIDSWTSVWRAFTNKTLSTLATSVKEEYLITGDSLRREISDSFYKSTFSVDPIFYQSGFQFRFVNYASRAESEIKGVLSNCDIWNLDFVYLNKDRSLSDTLVTDVALQQPLKSILKDFETMPWVHLKTNPRARQEQLGFSMVDISFNVSNLFTRETQFNTRFDIECVKGGTFSRHESAVGQNIQPDTTRTFIRQFPVSDFINTPDGDADSVAFDIKIYIDGYTIDPQLRQQYRNNDTNLYRQIFYDYYAYDDGSAENGYGIYGNNAIGSAFAMKYHSYIEDTLSAVYIYFNETQDSGNYLPFTLAVLAANGEGGRPGDVLYTQTNLYPQFNGLNIFAEYRLNRKIVVEGDFYVGIVQQSASMLNVGFDVNNRGSGKMYKRIGGGWDTSTYHRDGSLMIRPSFQPITWDIETSIKKEHGYQKLSVYPNPARDELFLTIPEGFEGKNLAIRVLDVMGRMHVNSMLKGGTIPISHLKQGHYFIQLISDKKVVGVGKFLVIK